jgi:hypothetical protein
LTLGTASGPIGEAEGTVHFALDGTEYEIDLNAQHVQAMWDALRAM